MKTTEFKFNKGQKVLVKKFDRCFNVLSAHEINGENVYQLDNFDYGFGRMFCEDELDLPKQKNRS